MKKVKRLLSTALCLAMVATLFVGCSSSSSSSSNSSIGKCTLTYTIWDKNQLAGMKAMADQFTKENPNITVNVEVTPTSSQYWTKLEAAANGGSLPDVFWMASNNFLKYAKGGKLMDLTSRIAGSSKVKDSNFPAGLVKLYTNDNKQYGIPKDYDTIAMWYNKTLFDKKGIKYPDNTWDWDKLKSAAKQLTDSSAGVWGFLSPVDDQNLDDDFAYQNDSYPISDDRTKSGYDLPATIEAIQYAVDFSMKDKTSPTTEQFSNTSPEQYLESGKAAMGYFGSWDISEFNSNDYVKANCDVAVLPQGKKQATIYNGLGNVVSATSKNPEAAWKFAEYLGTEEANKIQAENGSAIPAYTNMMDGFAKHFSSFNVKVYSDMLSYAVLYPTNWEGAATFKQQEGDGLVSIYSGKKTVEQGCKDLASKMNEDIAATK